MVPNEARIAREITLGKSRVAFERGALVIDIDEATTPFPGRVKGRVRLHPELLPGISAPLDTAGRHQWWPIAPLARVEVDLSSPGIRFRGHGYHDANAGSVPIETSFSGWTWSRARIESPRGAPSIAVAYDVVERDGEEHTHGMLFDTRGTSALDGVWRAPLPGSLWGLDRSAAADAGHAARVSRSLTDSPFYARALVQTRLLGRDAIAVHEVLSAERLRRAWVRFLLGFRMARDR